MIVALPFCHKDEHLALLNLEWCLKLDGGQVPFECVLTVDDRTEVDRVQELAGQYFQSVRVCRYPFWSGNPNWPAPHNHAWQQTARYFDSQPKGQPWLWWEADATPLAKGWLSTLQAAYEQGAKPFAGHWVTGNNGHAYMNGVGIYPPQVNRFDTASYLAHQASFDIVLGPRLATNCHRINHLIAHSLEPASFSTVAEIWQITGKEAVLFHNCKDGSIVKCFTETRGQKIIAAVSNAITAAKEIFVEESPITVVITNFKRPDRVNAAFQSCLVAGVHNIVISGSGVDAGLAAVHNRFLRTKSDVVIDDIPEDRGCNEMWLRGIRKSKTPWVHILHDDDELLPGFKQIESLIRPDLGFVYWPSERRFFETNKYNGLVTHFPNFPIGLQNTDLVLNLLSRPETYSISPVQGLFHREDVIEALEESQVIERDLELRPGMMVGNDMLIWLRAAEKHNQFWLSNQPMCAFGSWSGSTTTDDTKNHRNKLLPLYNRTRDYFFSHPRLPVNPIALPNVTLFAVWWSEADFGFDQIQRVIRYCQKLFTFGDVVLFAFPEPSMPFDGRLIRIPKLDAKRFDVFLNRDVPRHITSDFAMTVQGDGFPIFPRLWDERFLQYDFIGAPWGDGVVGNAGFCIQSQKLMQLKSTRVLEGIAADTLICRTLRAELEAHGCRFAPKELALKFSTEEMGDELLSFGFHGRPGRKGCVYGRKFVAGWKIIEQSEVVQHIVPHVRVLKKSLDVIVLYLRIVRRVDPSLPEIFSYRTAEQRFLRTYQQFKPQASHRLGVVNCGADKPDGSFDEITDLYFRYDGFGSDCGSFQAIGRMLDCDLVVCCNTIVHFWTKDWLEPIIKAAASFGPGVYGPSASYEQNPHLRTPCIAFHPSILRQYPYPCETRQAAGDFEHGPQNFSLWAHEKGFPVMLVTHDTCYYKHEWRKADNIYRRGDQSNCLVWDRHTEVYAKADAATKKILEQSADGC